MTNTGHISGRAHPQTILVVEDNARALAHIKSGILKASFEQATAPQIIPGAGQPGRPISAYKKGETTVLIVDNFNDADRLIDTIDDISILFADNDLGSADYRKTGAALATKILQKNNTTSVACISSDSDGMFQLIGVMLRKTSVDIPGRLFILGKDTDHIVKIIDFSATQPNGSSVDSNKKIIQEHALT